MALDHNSAGDRELGWSIQRHQHEEDDDANSQLQRGGRGAPPPRKPDSDDAKRRRRPQPRRGVAGTTTTTAAARATRWRRYGQRGSTNAPDLVEEAASATGTGRQLGLCLELEDEQWESTRHLGRWHRSFPSPHFVDGEPGHPPLYSSRPIRTYRPCLGCRSPRVSAKSTVWISGCVASPTIANVDDCTEGEGALGYTMTEICDKFIEFFMYKKPQTKDWRKLLVFREEWERYRPYFYKHSQARIDMENDSSMKQKLVVLARKVKKIDDEIEKHMELFTQLRENPTDINGIVARRRKDFNGGFFQHLNFLVNAYNGLDERDEMKLLKYLLNIEDPEERFGALATAFSPGDEHEAKDEDALYT
uniref:Endoribonuclease E-like protein n=1 Tax=Oryza sativa subsp. indica TaxID=39946 RepID=C8TFH0_ORYSI|nr:endoribonuclease E-like protein [Oryza sativa Indica Group]